MKKEKFERKEDYKPKHIKHYKRKKLHSISILFILIFFCCLMLFSAYKIYKWVKDNRRIKDLNNLIQENISIEENDEEGKLVNPEQDKESDYWYYVHFPFYEVDFNELLQKNKDTIGFIHMNNTNINYPIVQTSNNSYYLTHAFDKSKNDAGWVFLDYRNNINDLQDNNIIYAHGRYDMTMFGSLKNVFKENWYENTENYVVHLSTPKENTLWQVFSVYKIKTETYYLTSSFGSTSSHEKFIKTIKSRSKYNFNTSVNTKDKILTLSTCYNQKEKVVLHAKLIKIQKR